MIARVTRCLTKQWLLLYYGGGGGTFKNVSFDLGWTEENRHWRSMVSALNRERPTPWEGWSTPKARGPRSCDTLKNSAATDRGSGAKVSQRWGTEWGEPISEPSRRPAQVTVSCRLSWAPRPGRGCAAPGLLPPGQTLLGPLVSTHTQHHLQAQWVTRARQKPMHTHLPK